MSTTGTEVAFLEPSSDAFGMKLMSTDKERIRLMIEADSTNCLSKGYFTLFFSILRPFNISKILIDNLFSSPFNLFWLW